jgi:adenylylsulfate kinase
MEAAFAVWLTGLPASGKSTIARELVAALQARGLRPAWLESDALRALLTPQARYDDAERDLFYGALAHLGAYLVQRGVPVILDATANRRAYRDAARQRIARFAEVFVDCPRELCEARDPKGLYARAGQGAVATLPGAQATYEPPLAPELTLRSGVESPASAADRVMRLLERRGWLAARREAAAT